MKRAVLTLLILALVSGLGLGAAALAVNSKRDAAYIAAVSETGGGVSLEGLRIGAQAEYRGKGKAQNAFCGSKGEQRKRISGDILRAPDRRGKHPHEKGAVPVG